MPDKPSSHRQADLRYVGRGAQSRPSNRFERLARVPEAAEFACSAELSAVEAESQVADAEPSETPIPVARRIATQYLPDESQTIVTQNDSPDVSFRYSVNPYRGCVHGCSYCYARPTHEYLGLDAGLDFETRILVKHRAPQLFRAWLMRSDWQPEPIMFSGVTDCYQPIEREYELTRQCLEVAWEARQPISIVTKNALIQRDLDLLREMARTRLIHVAISVTTLRQDLSRVMEPRTSSPAARLATLRALADAGVPAQVMVAPIIPGLNDHEIPAILQAARDHGASQASYTLLRLPLTVLPVFEHWLEQTLPFQSDRVKQRIQSVRSGKMNDSQFGSRLRGTGAIAEQIAMTFRVFQTRCGLSAPAPDLSTAEFRPPRPTRGQLRLF